MWCTPKCPNAGGAAPAKKARQDSKEITEFLVAADGGPKAEPKAEPMAEPKWQASMNQQQVSEDEPSIPKMKPEPSGFNEPSVPE